MIELQPFLLSDVERLITWVPDARFALQWSGGRFNYPLDVEQMAAHLGELGGSRRSLNVHKAIELRTAEMVGYCELSRIDWTNRCGVVSRVLVDPARRRRGIGSTMVRLLTDSAFGELGLHRLELFTANWNVAAIRCYESLGFMHEGVHRDERRFGDEYWSIVHMSMLQSEWRGQR